MSGSDFAFGSSDLLALYREHDGKVSDKWLSYLTIYEQLFRPFRDCPVRILEIGVQNGGSLEIWSRYFRNAERIVGCDIDPRCGALTYDDPRISVVVGDSNSPGTFARIMAQSDRYDIIIDDGSHRSSDIIRSFALYFPRLVEGGLFVAEDLHCSYWTEFEGGIEAPYSAISFFKRLADFVNREHWGAPVSSETLLSFFARFLETGFDGSSLDMIDEVRFRNSVCIVSKGKAGANLLGQRVIAGSVAGRTRCRGARRYETSRARPVAEWLRPNYPSARRGRRRPGTSATFDCQSLRHPPGGGGCPAGTA